MNFYDSKMQVGKWNDKNDAGQEEMREEKL